VPVVYFRKEATPTPDQRTWRARIAANEKPLIAAFLAWVDRLHEQLTDNVLANAIIHRSAGMLDHILQAVAFQPVLYPVAVDEAERAFEDVSHLNPYLHLSFNLHNPHFDRMVQAEQARLVREVTTETRRAIANVVSRGYASGVHPYVLAPQIREVVGLTSRQANAVMNFAEGQRKLGRSPDQVAGSAMRYAGKMRTARAKTIAVTETARAATRGRLAGWDDAARSGLFNYATAEMEWSAVQDDPTEICAILNGTRVPLGQTWDGLLPGEAHPRCKCAAVLRLPSLVPVARPSLTIVKDWHFDPGELRDDHGKWTVGGALSHALHGITITGTNDQHVKAAISDVLARDHAAAGAFPAAMQGHVSLVKDRQTYMALSMSDKGIGIHAPDLSMPALERSFSKAHEGYNAGTPSFAYSLFHEIGHVRQLQYSGALEEIGKLLDSGAVKASDFGEYASSRKDEVARIMEIWAETYAAARTGQADRLPKSVQEVLTLHGIGAA